MSLIRAPGRGTKYVLIIPDGAADLCRDEGRSPLCAAATGYMDFIAQEGVCGTMQTLYSDLPRGSLVAHLGLLGWDPHSYFPCGRSSCELLGTEGIHLDDDDVAFRANFVRMEGRILASYNADFISSRQAIPMVDRITRSLGEEFSDFELYHHSDFRNTLVVRKSGLDPRLLICAEPHESHGKEFDPRSLVAARSPAGRAVAQRINRYLAEVHRLLSGEQANMIFPWSPSRALRLPPFREITGFEGAVGIVGAMEFIHGIAKASGMCFEKAGNGRMDTDYRRKGALVRELLAGGFSFVVCHVNAPDEASHMGDLKAKIRSLEEIDRHIVKPVVEYFLERPNELGGVAVVPDHYTNVHAHHNKRVSAHSAHPVPFAIWDGRRRDAVRRFSEDDILAGHFGPEPVNHLDLLPLLGVARNEVMA